MKFTPNKLMIGLFSTILVVVPLITAFSPKLERSEMENRSLAKMPTLINDTKWEKAENLNDYIDAIKFDYLNKRDGTAFKDDFETYFCDHLVGRELWVKLCNQIQMAAGKQEINEVYTLKNQMIQSFKEYDKAALENAIDAINIFAERHPELETSIMVAPTAQEIFFNKLPGYAGLLNQRLFIDMIYDQMNIPTINVLDEMHNHSDEYIYYRTDHHWTSLGAYYAYCSAAETLGFDPISLEEFDIERASDSFKGTLYSKTLDDRINSDIIDYYHWKNEPSIKMSCNDGMNITEYDSLYVRDWLDVKDKYSSFTGSNVPVVDIETDIDNDKSILIIKDSYAHSLAPFLANHYSRITMVDMRYINSDLNRVVDLEDYDQVLFMYNAITFAQDANNINKLKITK